MQENKKITGWREDVPFEHIRLVETGRFDKIPQTETYIIGEAVLTRFSNVIYAVLRQTEKVLVIGYTDNTNTKMVIRKIAKDDVRSYQGYDEAISEFLNSNGFIDFLLGQDRSEEN